jgi:hypothetical protein
MISRSVWIRRIAVIAPNRNVIAVIAVIAVTAVTAKPLKRRGTEEAEVAPAQDGASKLQSSRRKTEDFVKLAASLCVQSIYANGGYQTHGFRVSSVFKHSPQQPPFSGFSPSF